MTVNNFTSNIVGMKENWAYGEHSTQHTLHFLVTYLIRTKPSYTLLTSVPGLIGIL